MNMESRKKRMNSQRRRGDIRLLDLSNEAENQKKIKTDMVEEEWKTQWEECL